MCGHHYSKTYSGLQKVNQMILRCIGHEWVYLTTFDIVFVGKGSNELPSGVLAMNGLIK